jgi:putative membrane protein
MHYWRALAITSSLVFGAFLAVLLVVLWRPPRGGQQMPAGLLLKARSASRGRKVVRAAGVATLVLAILLVVMTLLPTAARAHTPEGLPRTAPLWQWNTEPWLLFLLALSALLYARGVWRLWATAGWGRGIGKPAVIAFGGGWVALVLALASPLDTLGGRLFSAHMVQHELLMVVAAPLLVLGRPLAAWTWAFGPAARRRLGKGVQVRWLASTWSTLTDPVVAWCLHATILWIWHVPALFSAALQNEAIHVLQHATFLVSALFFWWTALGHDPRTARGTGMAVGSLFTTMLHTAVLGALLSLAPAPWYTPYLATTSALGMDPVEDQQLGGLVMWVPSGFAYVIAALALLGRMLTRHRA